MRRNGIATRHALDVLRMRSVKVLRCGNGSKLASRRAKRRTKLPGGLRAKSMHACKQWGQAFQSVPTDRGWEFSALGDVLEGKVYVCDPHQPIQRGTNENQIGRLRAELPEGVSMNKLSAAKLKQIENKHNNTPRKALGYRSPFEVAFNRSPNVAI